MKESWFGHWPSRRAFVAGAAVSLAAPIRRGFAREQGLLAYIGSYSDHPAADGPGDGIYLVRLDPASARLANLGLAARIPASWLALSPDRRFLYATTGLPPGNGSVAAFGVDRASGALTALNTVSSAGVLPAHLSVHPSGRFAFVANYVSGSLAVLPIAADGSLGEAVAVETDEGPLNPDRAADEPPGNFAKSDHGGAHVHMVAADPTGRFLFASDAGLDRIYVWRFDPESGKLAPADPPFVPVTPGAAPRHFAFHPSGRYFYSLLEHSGRLLAYRLDPATAGLTLLQSVSVLPEGFAGSNLTSELVMAGDGRFLYAGNRLHDTVSILSVGGDGRVKLVGETPVLGDYPWNLDLSPDGRFLLSCNQRGDSITLFRRDRSTGSLRFTGDYLPIPSPLVAAFL